MMSSWWTTLPEGVGPCDHHPLEGVNDPAESGDAVEDPRDDLGARPDGRSRSIALQPGELHPGIPVHADKRHRLLHYPTSDSCHACRIANMRNVRHEQKKPDADEPPVDKFGQHVTMDFIIAKAPKFEEISGFENALLFYDVGTGWMQLYPTTARTTGEVVRCLEHATGHNEEIKYVYSDGATEFVSACRKLKIHKHDLSPPGDPQANGIIERRVQIAKRGGRALMVQCGLPDCFAFWAIQAFLFAYNTIEKVERNQATPYEQRFGRPFRHQLVEFGSLVHFIPSPASDLGKQKTSYGPTTVAGIFLGYEYSVGGRWRRNYKVCPLDRTSPNC